MARKGEFFSIEWLGAAALAQTLRDTGEFLKPTAQRNVMRKGMVEAAQPMADMMAELAPVEEADLKEAIRVYERITPRQRRGQKQRPESLTVYPGVRAGRETNIGIFQEFGTDERFQRGGQGLGKTTGRPRQGKSVGKVEAQPFARPAFEATALPVLARLGPAAGKQIEAAATRARKRNARKRAKGEGISK